MDGRALFLCQGWPALLAEEQEGDSWDEDLHLNIVYYSSKLSILFTYLNTSQFFSKWQGRGALCIDCHVPSQTCGVQPPALPLREAEEEQA